MASPKDVLTLNRQIAFKLADSVGKRRTLDVLEKAQATLVKRLAQVQPGQGTFTAVQRDVTLRQVQDTVRALNGDMRTVLLDQADSMADAATEGLFQYLHVAGKEFTGVSGIPLALREAAVLDRAHMGARSSVLYRLGTSGDPDSALENEEEHRAKQGILDRYGIATIGQFEELLQQGMLTQKPFSEIRDELVSASPFLQGQPKFWAERMVRTESMGAYNRAGWEGIREADDELGDMVKILSATFDERTGWDSYQVHGQIRRPDEAFEWADGLYQSPPNRPNDREIVVPHRISWPIPPYLKWKSDEEVLECYMRQRKKGTPGPRPEMTTVPMEEFGKGLSVV